MLVCIESIGEFAIPVLLYGPILWWLERHFDSNFTANGISCLLRQWRFSCRLCG